MENIPNPQNSNSNNEPAGTENTINPGQAVNPGQTPGSTPSQPQAAPQPPDAQQPSQPAAAPAANTSENASESDKDYLVAFLLSWFVGWLGIDRFYVGHTLLGVLKLVTLGGLGFWALVDFALVTFGYMKDDQGRQLANYERYKKVARIIFAIVAIMTVLSFVGPLVIMLLSLSSL